MLTTGGGLLYYLKLAIYYLLILSFGRVTDILHNKVMLIMPMKQTHTTKLSSMIG